MPPLRTLSLQKYRLEVCDAEKFSRKYHNEHIGIANGDNLEDLAECTRLN